MAKTLESLRVCFTGVSKQDRSALSADLRVSGAMVDHALTRRTTHLVVGRGGTEKHLCAVRNGSPAVVAPIFVHDCVAAGRVVKPEAALGPLSGTSIFAPSHEARCEALGASLAPSRGVADIAVGDDGTHGPVAVSPRLLDLLEDNWELSAAVERTALPHQHDVADDTARAWELWPTAVWSMGLSRSEHDALSSVVSRCGIIRCPFLTDETTHVVIGSSATADDALGLLHALRDQGFDLTRVVTPQWIAAFFGAPLAPERHFYAPPFRYVFDQVAAAVATPEQATPLALPLQRPSKPRTVSPHLPASSQPSLRLASSTGERRKSVTSLMVCDDPCTASLFRNVAVSVTPAVSDETKLLLQTALERGGGSLLGISEARAGQRGFVVVPHGNECGWVGGADSRIPDGFEAVTSDWVLYGLEAGRLLQPSACFVFHTPVPQRTVAEVRALQSGSRPRSGTRATAPQPSECVVRPAGRGVRVWFPVAPDTALFRRLHECCRRLGGAASVDRQASTTHVVCDQAMEVDGVHCVSVGWLEASARVGYFVAEHPFVHAAPSRRAVCVAPSAPQTQPTVGEVPLQGADYDAVQAMARLSSVVDDDAPITRNLSPDPPVMSPAMARGLAFPEPRAAVRVFLLTPSLPLPTPVPVGLEFTSAATAEAAVVQSPVPTQAVLAAVARGCLLLQPEFLQRVQHSAVGDALRASSWASASGEPGALGRAAQWWHDQSRAGSAAPFASVRALIWPHRSAQGIDAVLHAGGGVTQLLGDTPEQELAAAIDTFCPTHVLLARSQWIAVEKLVTFVVHDVAASGGRPPIVSSTRLVSHLLLRTAPTHFLPR